MDLKSLNSDKTFSIFISKNKIQSLAAIRQNLNLKLGLTIVIVSHYNSTQQNDITYGRYAPK